MLPTPGGGRPTAEIEQIVRYGLARPRIADALESLDRVFGPDTVTIWHGLMAMSGLTGSEDDDASVHRLVRTMLTSAESELQLCGQALQIRLSAFEHLSRNHQIVNGRP